MIDVLLITNKADVTTDFVIKRLTERQASFYRFNTEDLLTRNTLSFNFHNDEFILFDNEKNLKIDLLKVKSVYYRRPVTPSFPNNELTEGEEKFLINEITYSLEGLYRILQNAYWISSVFSIREAENKIFQLRIAKEMGFKVPASLITNRSEIASKFIDKNITIIKPIKTGLIDDIKNDKVIFTTLLKDKNGLERIQFCPTYFQAFINKVADIRVTVVGKKIFSALIFSQEHNETKVDWRNGENLKLQYQKILLAEELSALCIKLTERLGLNFGAIDLVKDENNNFYFLEINPNGQWAWIEKQLNYSISDEICNQLINGN